MISGDRRLVLILVDGLGFVDIEADRTPFLHSELTNGGVLPLQPALGYSDVQRAVLLTGRQPDSIGYWMLYRFAVDGGSPWRWLSPLSPLDRLGDALPVRLSKLGMSMTALKMLSRGRDLAIHNMPFRALKWLQPANEPSSYAGLPIAGTGTLLSRAADTGIPWSVIRSDSFFALVRRRSVTDWLPAGLRRVESLAPETRIVFMYLHFPDLFAHRFGMRSDRAGAEVRRVDNALPVLIDAFKKRLGDETEFVVVSDHGMSDTQTFVDMSDLVRHPEFGKSFVVALDSTLVRAVYLDDRGREAVRSRLEREPARLLTAGDRSRFGINFAPELYGEDIFLFNEGASIYPNYHSLTRPMSMHAYDPTLDSQTAFVHAGGEYMTGRVAEIARNGDIKMQDVFPVMAEFLGEPGWASLHGRT